MLIAYRVNPVSAWIVKRQCTVKYVNLINILYDREVVPELLQNLCTPTMIANTAAQLLDDPARRQRQKEMFQSALAQLSPAAARPSDLAADAILQLL